MLRLALKLMMSGHCLQHKARRLEGQVETVTLVKNHQGCLGYYWAFVAVESFHNIKKGWLVPVGAAARGLRQQQGEALAQERAQVVHQQRQHHLPSSGHTSLVPSTAARASR